MGELLAQVPPPPRVPCPPHLGGHLFYFSDPPILPSVSPLCYSQVIPTGSKAGHPHIFWLSTIAAGHFKLSPVEAEIPSNPRHPKKPLSPLAVRPWVFFRLNRQVAKQHPKDGQKKAPS